MQIEINCGLHTGNTSLFFFIILNNVLMDIKHYISVAKHFKFWQHEFWLALVHDLVEDQYLGTWILKYWSSLDHITRRHNEQYFDYINRVKLNKTATNVKLADLTENMKRCSQSLLKRYQKAKSLLE